ncbi:MAG: P-loop NTPase [Culicoidibacterales bacterium]
MNVQTIAQAIQNIIDPITKLPLIESKTLLDLTYTDGRAELTFAFERQNTPEFAAFQKYLLKTLKIELGIKGVKIHYAQPNTQQTQSTTNAPSLLFTGPKNARYIAIASGKGGVGKSTITVELAKAFQLIGKKVAIVDTDVYGASIAKILGAQNETIKISNGKIIPLNVHNISIIGIDLLNGTNDPILWRGPMLGKLIQQFFTDVAWEQNIDIVLIDLPPGTGDVPMTIQQVIPQTEVLLVTTPQSDAAHVAIRAGVAAIDMGHPLLGIIENMAYYTCTDCGQPQYIFGRDGGEHVASTLQSTVLAKIPLQNEKTNLTSHFQALAIQLIK